MKSKLAIISFILSLITLFLFIIPLLMGLFKINQYGELFGDISGITIPIFFSIPFLSILTIILSSMSFFIIRNKNLEGSNYSLAGIVISVICGVAWFIYISSITINIH